MGTVTKLMGTVETGTKMEQKRKRMETEELGRMTEMGMQMMEETTEEAKLGAETERQRGKMMGQEIKVQRVMEQAEKWEELLMHLWLAQPAEAAGRERFL